MSTIRSEILKLVAERILKSSSSGVLRVGIDGVDGAGKTVFGDELTEVLCSYGANVIRASVDSFHNSRSVRYRLGRTSPEGFFRDSYNYIGLKEVLLGPLGPNGTKRFRRGIFDHTIDRAIEAPEEVAVPGSVLVFDGIFLHREELRGYWDFSVFLEVSFDVSIPRGAQRGTGSPDPKADSNRRYVEGQLFYLQTCKPREFATMTIDNNDLAMPKIVSATGNSG